MGKGDVKILILGDAQDAKRAFADAERYSSDFHGKASRDFDSTGRKADGFKGKLSGMGTVIGGLAAVGFGALVVGANDAVQAASHFQETLAKAGTVFGDQIGDIKAWGEAAAETMLMSKNEAIGAAATYGNLFQAMGVTKDTSAGMSKSLVGLAADLGSFNDVPVEEVFAALQSGLTGEIEPMRRFGSNLSAVRIDAEALRLGLVKSNVNLADVETATIAVTKANQAAALAAKEHGYGSLEYRDAAAKVAQAEENLTAKTAGKVPELDAAQKAQAAYSLIMQDTALAQGDIGRTADSAANKQKALQARFENLKIEVGEKLLPIYVGAMDLMSKALDGLKAWWDENGPGIIKWFKDTFGDDPIQNFKNGLNEVKKAGEGVADWWRENIGTTEDLKNGWAKLKEMGESVSKWWSDNIGTMDDFRNGLDKIKNAAGWLGDKFVWLKDKVLDPLWGTLQNIKGIWDGLKDNELFKGIGQGFANSGNPLGKLMGAATGGNLSDGMTWVGENGPELAVTSGGQSRIIPNQNTGAALAGSQATIVETPIVLTLDGNVIARSTRRRELQIR